jgi:hypothetical protein
MSGRGAARKVESLLKLEGLDAEGNYRLEPLELAANRGDAE